MGTAEQGYFRALHRVAVTINSSLEPVEVLQSAARSATEAMAARACSLMLLSADGRELRHSVDYGHSPRYLDKGPVSVDLSMADALRGCSVAVLDAGNDPRCQYGPEAVREGIVSILSVPVRLRSEVVGVMRVYTAEPREFSEGDVEFVEALANLAAIALANARVHQEMKAKYEMVSRYVFNDAAAIQLGVGAA